MIRTVPDPGRGHSRALAPEGRTRSTGPSTTGSSAAAADNEGAGRQTINIKQTTSIRRYDIEVFMGRIVAWLGLGEPHLTSTGTSLLALAERMPGTSEEARPGAGHSFQSS